MTIDELLVELKINKEYEIKDDIYNIELKDSDEYAKIYSLLDKSDLTDLDNENTKISETESSMVYLTDDYDITLYSNFDTDEYLLKIQEA